MSSNRRSSLATLIKGILFALILENAARSTELGLAMTPAILPLEAKTSKKSMLLETIS